ncbi:hypothetical protein [Streptomyces sp. TE5632]
MNTDGHCCAEPDRRAVEGLLLFSLASAVAGAAYAFDFAGGLTVLSRSAPAPHRAGMVSGDYLVGYAAQGIGAPAPAPS